MNRLLSDSLSLLADYDFEEIIITDSLQDVEVDGVTSATLPAIKDYVVEGAAYTTLKLWHIIYGPTKKIVEDLTEFNMSEELTNLLLKSGNSFDVVWAVQKLNAQANLSNYIQSAIAYNLGDNYSRTSSVLSTLNEKFLDSGFQWKLYDVFIQSDYSTKELIVDKLYDLEKLDKGIVFKLIKDLHNIQGGLFVDILELIGGYHWDDVLVYRSIAELLQLPNRFQSGKVYKFLKSVDAKYPEVLSAMENYDSDH